MGSWQQEIEDKNYFQAYNLEKSFSPDLITESEFKDLLDNGYELVPDTIEKAEKDTSKLIKKEVWVSRGGKTFKQTVYVKPASEEQEETPVGFELSPEVKGMQIEKYSDKAILIKGDTYANVDTMRGIKKEIGAGSFNKKLSGWVFPIKFLETVLGYLWSDVKEKDEEKAEAIKNQKNSGLDIGQEVNIGEEKGTVEENVSDNTGIKYNIKTETGLFLNRVDERILDVQPETDNKKISEILNNVTPESRFKTTKKLFGIKPIQDIHNYSLREYMELHGISNNDIEKAINRIKGKKEKSEESKPKASTSGGGGVKKEKNQELTKNQIISKLVYNHYQAVRSAVEKGEELRPEALELYDELKTLYNQKRKAMSEETKRKISEALKKNKQEAEEVVDNFTKEEIEEIKPSFKDAVNEKADKEQSVLADMLVKKEKLEGEIKDLREKETSTENYADRSSLGKQRLEKRDVLEKLKSDIRQQKNVIKAISNNGDLTTITDKVGVKHDRVPDFTKVDTEDIDFNVDNILTKDKPYYIPEINEDDFRSGGYIFDVIKIGDDKYMLSTNKYKEFSEVKDGLTIERGDYNPKDGNFVMMTLDQVVLTQDYYSTKQKAKFKQEAERKNKRQLEHWNTFTDKSKEYYYNQRNFYEGMPVAVKKKISKDKWESLSVEEKEEIYIPVKKYRPEKLKSKFDDKHMANSFHSMYERFVDPEKLRTDGNGRTLRRGVRSYSSYAHPEVFQTWRDYRQTIGWKINDISIQREQNSEQRGKALETSYGESGTKDILKDKYGIKVKRQNGEEIQPIEVEQIEKAWNNIQKTYGNLKESASKDNLKISHAGQTYMFASKAIGVYVPSMGTIGVTAKLGDDQLGFTLGHEVAHWLDDIVGRKEGKRHASDNYDSTAGQIATIFRQKMNKASNSNYLNSTHECLARAFEMHHAVQTEGVGALRGKKDRYQDAPEYVSLDVYENQLQPLIKQFLNENKDILKAYGFDLFG